MIETIETNEPTTTPSRGRVIVKVFFDAGDDRPYWCGVDGLRWHDSQRHAYRFDSVEQAKQWWRGFKAKDPSWTGAKVVYVTLKPGPSATAIERLKADVTTLQTANETLQASLLQKVDLQANVRAFHRDVLACDLPASPGVPADDIVRRRARLITEEYIETVRSVFRRDDQHVNAAIDEAETLLKLIVNDAPIDVDLPEFIDGLADLEYVTEGGFLDFGVDSRPVHTEVQRANMSKRDGPRRADGKIGKPVGWTSPDIAGIIARQVAAGAVASKNGETTGKEGAP